MFGYLSLLPRRRAGLVLGIGIAVLALLGALAYFLADSQAQVRRESEKRFQTRATVSAALTEALFASAATQGQEDAAKRFGGRSVDRAALAARAKRSRQAYIMILDGKGKLLAATSGAAPNTRRRAAGLPRHIAEAIKGQAYLSGALPNGNGGRRVLEWALPFKTRSGPRVQVSGMRMGPIVGFLAAYLARARESRDMEAHLIDESAGTIASTEKAAGRGNRLHPDLSAALALKPHGAYSQDGADHYFAAAPVAGSSWRVVVSEPTSDLYPILAQDRTWVLWGVLAAFAIAAAICLFLLRRLLLNAVQLTRANKQLVSRQQELALTNERLEEQKQAAQEANRAKDDFLANISHELRTPLTSIVGFSELLMAGTAGKTEEQRNEFLNYVASNARHLEQLINDILDLSKVEAGMMDFKAELVDLGDLVDELTSAMSVVAERNEIELVTRVAPAARTVVSDPARLRQVLYNYLSNALKFTLRGGRVVVRIDPEGSSSFRLAVEDTGVGISPEDQGKLFRHFQQLDQTPRKEHQGTGLGLALVKELVEAQGGRVGLESTPGKGSVFYAVLPRDPSKARSAALPEQAVDAGEPALSATG